MIGLKSSICATPGCGITISNITNYKDACNLLGFFKPGVDVAIGLKEYYIDDVYLFTYIIKNNSDGTVSNIAFSGNEGRIVTFDSNKTFEGLMADAEITQTAELTSDGYLMVYHIAIPKESIKDTTRATAPYLYYVKDDKKVYTLQNSVEVEINLFTLLTNTVNWTSTNICVDKTEMMSKCYLDTCLSYILEKFSKEYTAGSCTKNDSELIRLRELRDLLFAISNTVEYYSEYYNYYKAAKLLEDVSFCSICSSFLKNVKTNCNCNG